MNELTSGKSEPVPMSDLEFMPLSLVIEGPLEDGYRVLDAEGAYLCRIVGNRERAEMFVRAVNSHDPLVKALEECAAAFKTPPGSVAQCQQAIAVEFQRRIDLAAAALAAAALAATGGQITSNADQPGT